MKQFSLVLLTVIVLMLALPNATFAKECKEYGPLGIPTWFRGLVDGECNIVEPSSKIDEDDEEGGGNSIEAFIAKIALNISDIIARIIGIVSVGFVIFGGFKYIAAQGNASKLQGAKTTITNAIIGLVISILATVIVNFIFNFFV